MADPTRRPSRAVSHRPVLQDTPPLLRFTVGILPEEFPLAHAPGFISSIDDALARLAHDGADECLEQLEISLVFGFGPYVFYDASLGKYATDHPHAALITPDHVSAWLRYGMAHAKESFVLEVPPCGPPKRKNEGTAIELPATAIGETLELALGNATITLPAPDEASFRNLTELRLTHARIVDGDRLGEFLSCPYFPSLEKLRLEYLVGVAELDLLVDELEELTIVGVRHLRCLMVNAERLGTLCITDCSRLESDKGQLGINAPLLEAFTCSNMCKLEDLQLETLLLVGEIGELPLWTHGLGDQEQLNQASILILKQCNYAHRLHLHLRVPNSMRKFCRRRRSKYSGHRRRKYSSWLQYENILVGEIPELPNVTALTVTITTSSGHSYAASLARLIAQCFNLEQLHIDVKTLPEVPPCSKQACLCNKEGGWEDQDFSLERLQRLDITGFHRGLDYENRLARMILAGAAPAIEEFKLPPSLQKKVYETLLPADSLQVQGRWVTCGDGVYKRTPN